MASPEVNLLVVSSVGGYAPPPIASPQPTFEGFGEWVRTYMQIPVQALPDGSPWTQWAYDYAIATVNLQIAALPGPAYLIAVYNLAGDWLIQNCPDVPPPNEYDYPGTDTPYFQYLRQQYGLNTFQPGLIQSSADEATSQSYMIPDAFKDMTMSDLNNLKTPYGRAYMAIAQKTGSLWGFSGPSWAGAPGST